MSFFSSKSELGVVFHIGSSSIGAGLVKFKEGHIPEVLHSVREMIPFQENLDPSRFFSEMIEALKRVNVTIAKEGMVHLKFTEFGSMKIRRVFYVFSSPWAVTQTKIVTIKKPESFTVSRDLVNKIVDAEERTFEKETINAGEGDLVDKLSVIEKRVIQVKLNGYEVSEPYGKTAQEADISMFISLIPKAVLDKTLEVSMSTYHPKDTECFSFPLVAFSTVRDIFHEDGDFLFLDIGGEISEIFVVKGGMILETASFPFGRHFLSRKVMKDFATTNEQAVSLLSLYFDNHADEKSKDAMEKLLKSASKTWMDAFSEVLTKLSSKMSLPSNIFVLMHTSSAPFFMRALKEERISEFGVVDVPFNVTLVGNDKLKGAVSFSKSAHKDPFIALLAAFVGRVYESKNK